MKTDNLSRRDALRLGVTIAGLPLLSTLSACRSNGIEEELSGIMDLVSEVAERIIPQTDTPGAIAAGVPDYIKLLLSKWYSQDESRAFIKRLDGFDDAAKAAGHQAYLQADNRSRNEILERMEAANSDIFRDLKQIVVFGYYTSEASAEELKYDPVPGAYKGCVPFGENDRAWLISGI